MYRRREKVALLYPVVNIPIFVQYTTISTRCCNFLVGVFVAHCYSGGFNAPFFSDRIKPLLNWHNTPSHALPILEFAPYTHAVPAYLAKFVHSRRHAKELVMRAAVYKALGRAGLELLEALIFK